MLSGAITVLIWIYAPITINGQVLSAWIYEIVPGFLVSGFTIIIVSLLGKQDDQLVADTFDRVKHSLDQLD
ncbi:MAG: Na+/proline symporter [Paraglaciecola sp.]|jgi:Na+/proline symporter